MRILSTRWHGILDYLVAALLIVLPWIIEMPQGPARNVPLILGIATITYSLLTRYEWGAVRVIPMQRHLALDLMNGLLLTLSPWLFGFAEFVWMPHLIIGLTELLVTAITKPATNLSRASRAGNSGRS